MNADLAYSGLLPHQLPFPNNEGPPFSNAQREAKRKPTSQGQQLFEKHGLAKDGERFFFLWAWSV